MLKGPFYHKTTRKIVSAFGSMFNNVWLIRYDEDMNETERIKVPLSFAQKEKFIVSLMMDQSQDKTVQVILPRMSFEFKGMTYDPTRKLPSINRIYTAHPTDSSKLYQNFSPVPYTYQFDLNIYARNLEDLFQLVEQIAPTFTPDFTVTISLIDATGQVIKKDVPITLDGIVPTVEYEGDGITPRYVTCLMPFTLQAYLYGPTDNSAIIRKAITNIYDTVGEHEQVNIVFNAGGAGDYRFEEEVYAGSWIDPSWRGRVLSWSNNAQNRLTIYEVSGNRLPQANDIVLGIDSEARWTIQSASRTFLKHAKTVIEPLPNTANVSDANISYTYVTTEFPSINE